MDGVSKGQHEKQVLLEMSEGCRTVVVSRFSNAEHVSPGTSPAPYDT